MARIITNTEDEARFPWPPLVFIQGGNDGLVIQPDGSTYHTVFMEAATKNTFFRGEGATMAEAEEACWEKYLVFVYCDNDRTQPAHGQPWHGPFERRHYTNGAGFCARCGTWFAKVFPPIPEKESAAAEALRKGMWLL